MKRPTPLVRLVLSVLLAAPGLLGAESHLQSEASTGRALGMCGESKPALGTQAIAPTSRGGAQAVAERARLADPCVTTLAGYSRDDPVAACHAILPRRLKPKAICTARQLTPDVVIAAEAVRATTGGSLVHYGAGKAVLHSMKGQLARRYKRFEPTVDQ